MTLIRTPKEAGSGSKIPPGNYTMTCTEVTEDALENPSFGTGEIIRFELETEDIFDEQGNPASIDAIANDKMSPKSKLWRWCEAFGAAPKVGEPFNLEQLIGCQAVAKIIDKLDEKGVPTGFTRVDDLTPLPGQKASSGPVSELSLSDWWKLVKQHFGVSQAGQKAEELFGQEPKDLTAAQRAEVLAKLQSN